METNEEKPEGNVISLFTGERVEASAFVKEPPVNPTPNQLQDIHNAIMNILNTQGKGIERATLMGVLEFCKQDVMYPPCNCL